MLKKNMSIGKLLTKISTPITCFANNRLKELLFFKKLVKILVGYLRNCEEVKTKRSEIEDLVIFKMLPY